MLPDAMPTILEFYKKNPEEVGRQRLVDSIAEYASNPAHSDWANSVFCELVLDYCGQKVTL